VGVASFYSCVTLFEVVLAIQFQESGHFKAFFALKCDLVK
jgi:hypothetical protein